MKQRKPATWKQIRKDALDIVGSLFNFLLIALGIWIITDVLDSIHDGIPVVGVGKAFLLVFGVHLVVCAIAEHWRTRV